MSQDSVAQFLVLVASEEALAAAMNAAAEQGSDVAATAVGLGEKHGIEFTSDEFSSAVEAFHREHSGELDDADLSSVSGGFNPQPEPPAVWGGNSSNPWSSQPWAINLRGGP